MNCNLERACPAQRNMTIASISLLTYRGTAVCADLRIAVTAVGGKLGDRFVFVFAGFCSSLKTVADLCLPMVRKFLVGVVFLILILILESGGLAESVY